ncbi:MAG: hypothetical protein R2847_08745 [Bacteroidia bacterium]
MEVVPSYNTQITINTRYGRGVAVLRLTMIAIAEAALIWTCATSGTYRRFVTSSSAIPNGT